MKLMMKFDLCLNNFSELFLVFRHQLLISLALRKCKKDCKILTIILLPDLCPLKIEIARFSIGFRF